jgi:hypothetical protein
MGRPSKIKTGDILQLKHAEVEILEFIDHKNILVRAIPSKKVAEGPAYWTDNSHLGRGKSTTPFCRTLYGKGYRGIGKYRPRNKTKVHSNWSNMLKRCYNAKFHRNNPTYVSVEVCDDWHNYQNFAEWHHSNYVEGWELDKDLKSRAGKVYSPETCLYLPPSIHACLKMESTRKRSFAGVALPYGVGFCKQTQRYSVSYGTQGGWGGRFDTPEEAFDRYLELRHSRIKEVVDQHRDVLDEETRGLLVSHTYDVVAKHYRSTE